MELPELVKAQELPLDVALKIIAGEGLRKFTAVAIAREIGTTDGNVFRHFPSKQAIVLAAVDRVEEILFGDLRPGQIVVVDAEGEGTNAVFSFEGTDAAPAPDVPPVEAAEG